MAVACWFVLLVSGSSQPPFAVTPVCRGQDLVVLLGTVSLVTIPRGGGAAPVLLSPPTVRARRKSMPRSRPARVLRWSCWSWSCFLKAKWVKNPHGVRYAVDMCAHEAL